MTSSRLKSFRGFTATTWTTLSIKRWSTSSPTIASQWRWPILAFTGARRGSRGSTWICSAGKPPRVGELSIGMIMQGVVDIDPDGRTAKGRWYCMSIEAKPTISLHEGELRQLWGNGIYENEYVKENGKWLFKKVFYFLNFRTPYEDGWLKVPVIGQHGSSSEVPPDAPPTNYAPYPSGIHLHPHYKHPITGK